MRVYFFNQGSVIQFGVAKIMEEDELPKDIDAEAEGLYVEKPGDCSFFNGTKKDIIREARRWSKLPAVASNIYKRGIGYAVLNALK